MSINQYKWKNLKSKRKKIILIGTLYCYENISFPFVEKLLNYEHILWLYKVCVFDEVNNNWSIRVNNVNKT